MNEEQVAIIENTVLYKKNDWLLSKNILTRIQIQS